MAAPLQSYKSHRRYHPIFHFFIIPVLAINVIVMFVQFAHVPGAFPAWQFLVACALLALGFVARINPLRVQDRLIRLEETLRLQRTLPPELQARLGELRAHDFVALRFSPDDELIAITEAILSGELQDAKAIKARIKNWREDRQRI